MSRLMPLTSSWGTALLLTVVVGCGGSNGGKGGPSGAGATGAGGTSSTGGTGGTAPQTTDYSFSINSNGLSLPPGGMQSVTVVIDRTSTGTTFHDPILFTLEVPNSIPGNGVTAAFAPNPATTDTADLTIGVAATVTPGNYTLAVVGTSGAQTYTVSFPLTVTSASVTTLLVDNDFSANNADPTDTTLTPSPSDALFASLLENETIRFNTFIVPTPNGTAASAPASSVLTGYSTIIWYTGNTYGNPTWTMSPAQQAILESWLGLGGKTLIVYSQNLAYDIGAGTWKNGIETDSFMADDIGAIGDGADGDLDHATYDAAGVTGTAFAGTTFHVIGDFVIPSSGDTINPASGTDVLATVMSNPHDELTGKVAAPIVVGRKHVGGTTPTNGTSVVVYVGLPLENVLQTSNNNTDADLFHLTLRYSGLTTL